VGGGQPIRCGLLTILGYSVHDTIVIFDRIRENVKLRKRPTLPRRSTCRCGNDGAVSQHGLDRESSCLICLYGSGGDIARLAGALIHRDSSSGLWSSIFIAQSVLSFLEKRDREALLRSGGRWPPQPRSTCRARKAAVAALKAGQQPKSSERWLYGRPPRRMMPARVSLESAEGPRGASKKVLRGEDERIARF